MKRAVGQTDFCISIDVPKDSKGYQKLAELVSASDVISCPRCGGKMVLCLKPDPSMRGVHFHGTFVCTHCDCGGCELNEE